VATSDRTVLVVTGGHSVDLAAFGEMLDAACADWAAWEHAVHPDARRLLVADNVGRWDAILLHDIAGLELRRGSEPVVQSVADDVRDGLVGMLTTGQGIVVTHHSLASWPAWDGWAHAVGGRFLYAPGRLNGVAYPASGYRIGSHTLDVVDPAHPVCNGLPGTFELDDEIYWCPVFDDEITPLLASRAELRRELFTDAYTAVIGSEASLAIDHPPSSRTVAWAKSAGRSPLVYLQPGHGPATFANRNYRILVANALRWVASPSAHLWAQAHPTSVAGR